MGKQIKKILALSFIILTVLSLFIACDYITQPDNGGDNSTNNNDNANTGDLPSGDDEHFSISFNNLKGADAPQLNRYSKKEGVLPDDMPVVEVEGWKFLGWYTASTGGELVDYIPAGSSGNYILFAHWEAETYTITYVDAPIHSNPLTYTIEDEVVLTSPEWSGLAFSRWVDTKGNPINKIEKGSIGNITVTAHWMKLENLCIPNSNSNAYTVIYDENLERYHFIIELGTLNNVVLGNLGNSRYKLYGQELNWEISEVVGFEENIANEVAKTVSNSVTKSKEWSNTVGWAKESSTTVSAELSAKLEAEYCGVKASVEASLGVSDTESSSWSNTTATGNTDQTGSENSESTSSTVAYKTDASTTVKIFTTTASEMPEGTYSYVYTGTVHVYAIVTYDPNEGNYYLDIYSHMDEAITEMTLYAPPADSKVNITSNNILAYSVPEEYISGYVMSSYYVNYDANGGDGEMPMSIIKVGEEQELQSNSFSKTGYTFAGWSHYTDTGVTVYENEQVVCDIAGIGESITLYAVWTPINYTITYNTNGGGFAEGEIYPTSYTVEDLPLTIPGLIYNEYSKYNHFDEWQENGVSLPDNLASNPRDLVLTASWDLCTTYTQMSSTPHTIDGRVIIDWRNEVLTDFAATTGSSLITVKNTSSELVLIGNPDAVYSNLAINFEGFEENQDFTLYLVNFNFITNQSAAIKPVGTDNGMVINIDISGKCSIGTTYASGANISGFTNIVNFTGEGDITMVAGNGTNATSAGGVGKNGGIAIIVENLTVDITGEMYITGGVGGNGANGANGSNGYSYSGHSDRNATGGGANGGNGNDGSNGGSAGRGGYAYDVTTITIKNGNVVATGGKSGNGGNGGNGGAGGKGQEAGGWGTTAGNGGNGGKGGNGGNTYIVAASDGTETVTSDNELLSLVNGAAGTVGKAGAGGAGGAKGMHCDGDNCGQILTSGNDGNNGKTGSSGSAGKVINIP